MAYPIFLGIRWGGENGSGDGAQALRLTSWLAWHPCWLPIVVWVPENWFEPLVECEEEMLFFFLFWGWWVKNLVTVGWEFLDFFQSTFRVFKGPISVLHSKALFFQMGWSHQLVTRIKLGLLSQKNTHLLARIFQLFSPFRDIPKMAIFWSRFAHPAFLSAHHFGPQPNPKGP